MFAISRLLSVTTKPRLHRKSLHHHHNGQQPPQPPPLPATFYLSHLGTNLNSLKKLHASLVVHGLSTDLPTSTKLLSLYASFARLCHARAVFDLLPTRDLHCFKAMIRAHFLNDDPSRVVSLYRLMRLSLYPTPPHDDALSSVVFKSCSETRDLHTLTFSHCHVIKSSPPDPFVLTCLVDAYAKCARVSHARLAFDEIPHPRDDVVSWTSMIAAYVQNDCAREGLTLFNKMREAFVDGNEFTLGSVVSACTKLRLLHQGKWLHGFVIKNGITVNSYLTTSLLNMYVKCGSIEDAREVFDGSSDRDLVSWTAMIVGYSQRGYPRVALELFKDKKWSGILPNSVTVSSLLSACARLGDYVVGKLLHGLMVKCGLDDHPVRNALVDMYAKCGVVLDARYVFESMLDKDVVSWNAIISGCVQSGEAYEALELFKRMRLEVFLPDAVTVVGILSACALLGALQLGCSVHGLALKDGMLASSIYVGTALLNFYAKCGDAKAARMVFDSMGEKNAVTWGAMIGGYGMQGDGNGSLELFRDMLKEEFVEPNEVVFTTILAACSHSGMVGEGSRLFNLMCGELNFVPSMKHYACMVDMLARAGNLKEALDFMERMPVQPSVSVFGAFLHGCGLHSRFELGEVAIKRMLELHPDEACYYVLVSNLYASDGRWGMVKQVREMIKQRGLNKIPGCSSVEMDLNNDTYARCTAFVQDCVVVKPNYSLRQVIPHR